MAKNDSNTSAQEVGFNLDWAKVNEWDWPDIVEPLHINITKNQKTTAATKPHDSLLLFPKVAYLYGDYKYTEDLKKANERIEGLNTDYYFKKIELKKG